MINIQNILENIIKTNYLSFLLLEWSFYKILNYFSKIKFKIRLQTIQERQKVWLESDNAKALNGKNTGSLYIGSPDM